MIKVVYAKATQRVSLPSGLVTNVLKGQHWPTTDPVVVGRPDLFTDDPRFGLFYTEAPPGYDGQLNELPPGSGRDIRLAPEAEDASVGLDDAEQATAAPGERRSARRRRSLSEEPSVNF